MHTLDIIMTYICISPKKMLQGSESTGIHIYMTNNNILFQNNLFATINIHV